MTREDRGPGRRFPGPRENDAPGAATVVAMVGHAGDVHRFGQPSTYSLPAAVLAAHVRELRRSGWQGWEVRRRFEWPAA
jgi:hypothetical protein